MEIYAGIAQGTISSVLYNRLSFSLGALSPRAMRKAQRKLYDHVEHGPEQRRTKSGQKS